MIFENIRSVAELINIWNSLPSEIVNAFSVNSFENILEKHWSSQGAITG